MMVRQLRRNCGENEKCAKDSVWRGEVWSEAGGGGEVQWREGEVVG